MTTDVIMQVDNGNSHNHNQNQNHNHNHDNNNHINKLWHQYAYAALTRLLYFLSRGLCFVLVWFGDCFVLVWFGDR